MYPDHRGQEVVLEAAQALLEYGFTKLQFHKIELACYSYDKQSQAAADKLGFTFEARVRDRKDARDKRCDDLRYGILKTKREKRHENI